MVMKSKRLESFKKDFDKNMWKNSWWLLIEKVDGGFVLSGTPESEFPRRTLVAVDKTEIEDPTNESEEEARLAHSLAYEVINYFGLHGSKHNKYRVHVSVTKRDDDE